VAFVQSPWAYLNEETSWITRVQATLLRAHFDKEKVSRAQHGGFITFNGTAGLWRKDAIEALGGFEEDCLTEDLALSVRAKLAGYRAVYLPGLACPSELPEHLADLKQQFFRWAKGSAQVFRRYTLPILRANVPWVVKLDMLTTLSRHGIFLVLLCFILSFPWVYVDRTSGHPLHFLDVGLMGLSSLLTYGYFRDARHGTWQSFKNYLGLSVLGLFLMPSQCLASLLGLVFHGGVFERTPKKGFATHHGEVRKKDPSLGFEFLVLLYVWGCVVVLFRSEFWLSKPILLLQALVLSSPVLLWAFRRKSAKMKI